MYMPAQIQLERVKMVEIEPESDVPGPGPAAVVVGGGGSGGQAAGPKGEVGGAAKGELVTGADLALERRRVERGRGAGVGSLARNGRNPSSGLNKNKTAHPHTRARAQTEKPATSAPPAKKEVYFSPTRDIQHTFRNPTNIECGGTLSPVNGHRPDT